jgi:four helix bundle protein
LELESVDTIRDFQDLEVWQEAMDLGERVYRLTWKFPRNEVYGLASQLQRASVSIPSKIAEGRMRGSLREFVHFVSIARASLAELRTQLIFAQRLGFTTAEEVADLSRSAEILARRLNALRKSLQARLDAKQNSGDSGSANSKTENLKPKTHHPGSNHA